MVKRVGMADLAAAAGVSVATVDRALNGREAVRAETMARLMQAAARIGHPLAARLPQYAADGTVLRIGVVLHKAGQEFYQDFAQALTLAVASYPELRAQLVLKFATSQSPDEVASLLRRMKGQCDVLAATAVNHPEITAAVTELKAAGLPVFALLSDFAQGVRAGYFGINNLKAGRIAGWITALAVKNPGKLAVFVGGHRWHGHDLREVGFRSYLREYAAGLTVLDTLVNLETRSLTYEATRALLSRQPDLRGIYVAGGGMEGAIAALREMRAPGEVALVVNELTSESRAALTEGLVTLVTATPLDALTRDLVAVMARAAKGVWAEDGIQHFLPPVLHVPEML